MHGDPVLWARPVREAYRAVTSRSGILYGFAQGRGKAAEGRVGRPSGFTYQGESWAAGPVIRRGYRVNPGTGVDVRGGVGGDSMGTLARILKVRPELPIS
ncbi:hypothetical protein SHKM778_84560 [Streptomyces sp. KM77-8]|uniref:Uncharacterized protein n=1 Tax=Streptomyces haneummycinicus TaxID=3074435 RepID=A0AAT9HYN9_9ACTN